MTCIDNFNKLDVTSIAGLSLYRLTKSLIFVKVLYNLITSLSVNQEEKEVKRLERSLVFKAKEVKGLYKLTKGCIIIKDFLELLYI